MSVPALVQRVQFAEAKTYPFAEGKFLNSVPVGFIPLAAPEPMLDADWRSMGGYEFIGMEFLDLSAVSIPANPEAVARAIDSGIVSYENAASVFVQQDEPGAGRDYIALAFGWASYRAALRSSCESCATRAETKLAP